MANLTFDARHFPFSRYGAMIAVTRDLNRNELMIHDPRAHDGGDRAVRVLFVPEDFDPMSFRRNDAEYEGLPFESTGTPTRLLLSCGDGRAEFIVTGDRRLRLRAEGLHVLLALCNERVPLGLLIDERRYEAVDPGQCRYIHIACPTGRMEAKGPMVAHFIRNQPIDAMNNVKLSPENGVVEADIHISQSEAWEGPDRPIEECVRQTQAHWASFLSRMPETPAVYRHFAEQAWYNLWSSCVRAQPPYRDDTILMSKKHMSAVWSWDHCFNALAVGWADAGLALNQFLAPFHLQMEDGSLPDRFGPDSVLWACSKPPVHGWCMSKLMEKHDYPEAALRKVYGHLEKWTQWWMTYRDFGGNGVPAYPRGCDSGLDNSTCFDQGNFVESADLSAYLALQMNCLADIAERLGEMERAAEWRRKAAEMIDRMIGVFWNGERFAPRLAVRNQPITDTGSILLYLPLALGGLLEGDIAEKVTEDMLRHNLTENGLASEAPDSPKYEPDGYWRGPIWAPTTYLIADGLRRMGKTGLAKEIARRFCDMCVEKAHGFYENFDALTGRGLRTPGYTWTSSVFLCMVWEYLTE